MFTACANRSRYGLLFIPPKTGCCSILLIWIVNIFLTPVILVARYFTAYVIPFIAGTVQYMFFYCCRFCINTNLHTDRQFGPNDDSLGPLQTNKNDIEWIRLGNVETGSKDVKKEMQLFSSSIEDDGKKRGCCETIFHQCFMRSTQLVSKTIDAEDISQGALGDCWLLSSLAALADQPHYIRKMFLTHQYNPRGKYRIEIYDPITKKNKVIEIDDWIPCNKTSKKPVFTHPHGKEGWVVLLEKMFAKYQRSYANIEGNTMLYAMIVLTGCSGNHFERTANGWQVFDLVVKPPKSPKDRDEVYLSSYSTEKRSDDDLFPLLVRLLSKRCIVTAGTKGEDKTIKEGRGQGKGKETGIVPGHAYSILRAYQPKFTTEKIRLVKLRNPWGSFEWKGMLINTH